MEQTHINERGAHTTVIEGAGDILKLFKKNGIEVSPGMIEGNVGGRGKSAKLKLLNTGVYEMVVVTNSAKQTFKVYGEPESLLRSLKARGWNIQDTLDLRDATS